jgi:hypothetical protein
MPGPPADPLTLTLACTVTVTLVDAVAAAATCTLHETASTPSLVAVVATFPAALTASGPCVCTAAMIAGKFT